MQNEGLETGKPGGSKTRIEPQKYSVHDPVLMDVGADVPAIVDFADALKVGCVRWRKDGKYVKSNGSIYLHRVIARPPAGRDVHHRDEDPMNNQRYNLEEKTKSIHHQHHSAKKEICGVWKYGRRYAAAIMSKKKRRFHLGTYDSAKEAGMVYDWAARILHGDGCLMNFPDRICSGLAAFLIRQSKGNSFDVTFTKRADGSSRTMRCRIAEPSAGGGTSPLGGPGPYYSSRLGLIVVREDGQLGYKAIPVEGITSLGIKGKTYTVHQEMGTGICGTSASADNSTAI